MAILIIFGDNMANLGLIDFKIGLHIKVNVNNAWDKTNVKSISQKIRSDPTLAREH